MSEKLIGLHIRFIPILVCPKKAERYGKYTRFMVVPYNCPIRSSTSLLTKPFRFVNKRFRRIPAGKCGVTVSSKTRSQSSSVVSAVFGVDSVISSLKRFLKRCNSSAFASTHNDKSLYGLLNCASQYVPSGKSFLIAETYSAFVWHKLFNCKTHRPQYRIFQYCCCKFTGRLIVKLYLSVTDL